MGLKNHRETARRPQPPSLSEVEVRIEARKNLSWEANAEEELGTTRVANLQLKANGKHEMAFGDKNAQEEEMEMEVSREAKQRRAQQKA